MIKSYRYSKKDAQLCKDKHNLLGTSMVVGSTKSPLYHEMFGLVIRIQYERPEGST